ncbi:MAG: histidinol dehydrogenase [Thermobacillus sp.]|nr:MAG: histidinol dehydrogenase [Thermobacillus sp.]
MEQEAGIMGLIYRRPEEKERLKAHLAARRKLFDRKILDGVLDLFDDVEARGDASVIDATLKFDGVAPERLMLDDEYIDRCISTLSLSLRETVDTAIRHVREVNLALLPAAREIEIRPGTTIGERIGPLDAVGIWIPSRKGPLLSTAIMLVGAARAAGVGTVVVGMPPGPDELADPATAAAAKLAGADRIVVGNGVAVIAAFACGTASIPETDGVFGPGPGGIGAAMLAAMMRGKRSAPGLGPSDSVVLADESADPMRLARDLANEAEHGPDSSSVLVTTSAALATQTAAALRLCLAEADEPRRGYLETVFGAKGRGAIVVASDLGEACAFINDYAPEHLMIVCEPETERLALERIRHAGEILLGKDTPFSAANYGIGITAVLPTNRFARAYSGVTVRDMMKVSTVGRLSENALRSIAPVIREFARCEGLPAHQAAADVRLRREGLRP